MTHRLKDLATLEVVKLVRGCDLWREERQVDSVWSFKHGCILWRFAGGKRGLGPKRAGGVQLDVRTMYIG